MHGGFALFHHGGSAWPRQPGHSGTSSSILAAASPPPLAGYGRELDAIPLQASQAAPRYIQEERSPFGATSLLSFLSGPTADAVGARRARRARGVVRLAVGRAAGAVGANTSRGGLGPSWLGPLLSSPMPPRASRHGTSGQGLSRDNWLLGMPARFVLVRAQRECTLLQQGLGAIHCKYVGVARQPGRTSRVPPASRAGFRTHARFRSVRSIRGQLPTLLGK